MNQNLITSNSSRLDRDSLLHIPRDRATECGYYMLDPLFQMKPHEALAAVAVAFAVVAATMSHNNCHLMHLKS